MAGAAVLPLGSTFAFDFMAVGFEAPAFCLANYF
jgi:hypothetical protein